ncbi:MAG: peptidoglycan DD-metalloendopeptidase family protein [Oscillospiraceae bacterium]|nr:peptidoglycan DD-metalloendopeptidase family protein [Oscillospiraceae bacterium]
MNNKKIASVIAIVLAVLMALMLVVSVIPARAFAVSQADIDAVQARKNELVAQQEATQQRIDELKEQQASLIEQKQALDERNTLAMAQIELVREQVQLYSQLIQEKEKEVEAARRVEEAQLARLRTRVRAMEENGSFDILTLLLHADSFSALLGAIDDIGLIMEKDQQLEQDYIAARTAHEQVQAEYEQIKLELENHQAELEAEQLELAKMIAESIELIQVIEGDLGAAAEALAELEKQEEQASQEIASMMAELERQRQAELERQRQEELRRQQQAGGGTSGGGGGGASGGGDPGSAVVGTGSLTWPVPSSRVVTSRFGNRDDPMNPGTTRFHSGMDIDGYNKAGKPVVACDAGTVTRASWYGGYGNCVIIDHGNGMQTLYGHLSGYAVSEGDTVAKGQTIGYLGATGNATGVHCHLEVFVNGGRVNPENYFSGMTFYNC